MRAAVRLAGAWLVLAAGSTIPLSGQASIRASVGARYTSTLVHDSIVMPLDVRADLAPALTMALELPLDGPWRLAVVADVTSSQVKRHEQQGGEAAQPITRVWSAAVGVGLNRRLNPWLESRVTVGGLKHLATSATGVYRDGGGGFAPFGSLAFDALPGRIGRRVALELAGDVHRFLTPALRSAGFVDARAVYRITIGARVELWRGRSR